MTTPPTTQKADQRPIAFLLSNQVTGQLTTVPLVIRPEELTRTAASRLMTTPTMGGGAWIDNFGPGLSQLQISGTTGWRGGFQADGAALFAQLKTTIFDEWHSQRADAVSKGQDPAKVQLVFADALDSFANVVVPLSFTLKRSRSRPLLMMYQIAMTVVEEQLDAALASFIQSASTSTGIDSLTDALNRIQSFAQGVANFLNAVLVAPFKAFMAVVNKVLGAALAVVNTIENAVATVLSPILALATDIAQVGRNIMYTVAAIVNLPNNIMCQVMQVASAFDDAFCVLKNVFKPPIDFPNYSDLYGASSCSSTSGGSPLSPLRNTNAFSLLAPPPAAPVSVAPAAASQINLLKGTDPVLAPMNQTQLATGMSTIGSSVAVAA